MPTILVVAAAVVLLGVLAFRAVFRVSQGQAVVLERLGRFQRVAEAGVHLRVPVVDRIRATVDLREQVLTLSLSDTVTSGNLASWVSMRATVQVVDATAAVYAHANWAAGIELLGRAELDRRLGAVPWPEAFPAGEELDDAILAAVRDEAARWGVRVVRVKLAVESRIFGAIGI